MALAWNDSFSVKITEIDNQHKTLVVMINKLHMAIRTAEAEDIVPKILEELMEYVKIHFETEERYLELANYPDFEEHKEIHARLAAKVTDMYCNLANSEILFEDMIELYLFLQEWLNSHLLDDDKLYIPFLKEFHDVENSNV